MNVLPDAAVAGALLALLALALRLVVHVGVTPSGVDTWYYLASAEALRRTRRLPISLPRYLLQDRTESYPPGLIVLLALLPRRFVTGNFWLIAPAIDVLHLLLLFAIVHRLTDSLPTAVVAGLIYALVPQLVAETRSLNPRSLGGLMLSVSMLLVFRFTLPTDEASSLTLGAEPTAVAVAAVVAIALLLLTQSATGAASLAVVVTTLSLVYGDVRYVAFALAGFVLAFLISGGFYARVLANLVEAVRFWRRNRHFRGAEPIRDSPIYGSAARTTRGPTRWRSIRWQVVRLVAENPFVIPMVLTPLPAGEWWGGRMYWWAVTVLAWALATTFVPPLRVFGPGYMYLKASVFPTALTLAFAIGPRAAGAPFDRIVAVAAVISVAAVAFFVAYTRRQRTQRTSSVPDDLARMSEALAARPKDGVLVLPLMYADYVCYHSGKKTLWGGHSGSLKRFEDIYPVVRRPFGDLIAEYDLHYALLDLSYVDPAGIRLEGSFREIARAGQFALYEIARA
ncbi:MAG: hypothetical protein HY553_19510 [Elusimicrobia bacterium]|nr:hypothetical protein [Elusimicrobiota bacterium]